MSSSSHFNISMASTGASATAGSPSSIGDGAASISFVPSNNITYMPEPSSQMPWNPCTVSWANNKPNGINSPSDDAVVLFNGSPICSVAAPTPGVPFAAMPVVNIPQKHLHKRKAMMDIETNITPLQKRHITDELMAQQLNGMHISNQYTTHQSHTFTTQDTPPSTSAAADAALQAASTATRCNNSSNSSSSTINNNAYYNTNRDLQRKLRNAQRITICDEIRRIQSDTLLPDSLLQRIERPCTAMVLWQPPLRLTSDTDKDSSGPASRRCDIGGGQAAMAVEDFDNNNEDVCVGGGALMEMDL